MMRIRELFPPEYHPACLPLIKDTMPHEVYASAVAALDGYHKCRRLWGAFEDGYLVGMCGYTKWRGSYWVSWTAVCPRLQHTGIGTRLLNKTIKAAADDGAMYIDVETYEHPAFFNAIKFYMKNGFRIRKVMRKHLSDGSSMLYLRRYLSPL